MDDIGRMVDEFSAFARMPQPVMQPLSLRDLVLGQVGLYDGHGVKFEIDIGLQDENDRVLGDAGLLRQALTNIIQNALDSLDEHRIADPCVKLALALRDGFLMLSVTDNGPGFPDIDRTRLLEPYVTKRDKGTGLGLAIVLSLIHI